MKDNQEFMSIQDVNYLLESNSKKIKKLEQQNDSRDREILGVLFDSNRLLQLKSKLILGEHHFSRNDLKAFQRFSDKKIHIAPVISLKLNNFYSSFLSMKIIQSYPSNAKRYTLLSSSLIFIKQFTNKNNL